MWHTITVTIVWNAVYDNYRLTCTLDLLITSALSVCCFIFFIFVCSHLRLRCRCHSILADVRALFLSDVYLWRHDSLAEIPRVVGLQPGYGIWILWDISLRRTRYVNYDDWLMNVVNIGLRVDIRQINVSDQSFELTKTSLLAISATGLSLTAP